MSCPFARVAAVLGIQPGSAAAQELYAQSPHHGGKAPSAASSGPASAAPSGASADAGASASASASASSLVLSDELARGTAAAHRAIERSPGVKAMMASVKAKGAAHPKDGLAALELQRIDYIRWLVMLDCVYEAMEQPLLFHSSARAPPSEDDLLAPLLEVAELSGARVQLMDVLRRTAPLRRDIAAHGAALEEETGLSVAEWVESAREQRTQSAAAEADDEHGDSELGASELLPLLTPRQRSATAAYVRALRALSAPASSSSSSSEQRSARRAGLLVSHIYTRYMGDLSGGQFMKRHLAAKWPCSGSAAEAGFEFYDFAARDVRSGAALPAVSHTALKDAVRGAIDAGFVRAAAAGSGAGGAQAQDLLDELVDEANRAFELNAGLFNALIDAEPDTEALPAGAAAAAAGKAGRRGRGGARSAASPMSSTHQLAKSAALSPARAALQALLPVLLALLAAAAYARWSGEASAPLPAGSALPRAHAPARGHSANANASAGTQHALLDSPALAVVAAAAVAAAPGK